MKSRSAISLVIITLTLFIFGCAHMSDPCDNKLLTRISSPDGNLFLATYHRECPSKIYTTAIVEKSGSFLQTRGEVVCYVMSWGGRHPIEAAWKDGNNIFISTTDRLERFDFEGSKESCSGIKINYSVQFRNEQQQSVDSKTVSKIKKVLSDAEQCITDYYKSANEANDPVKYMNELIDKGEHRSAVELILGYTYSASCPILPATYDSFKELSDTFDLKPEYLERVTPLVKR